MRKSIFTSRERQALEAYLTGTKADKAATSEVLSQIRKNEYLFEDVYLYLRVRKTLHPE